MQVAPLAIKTEEGDLKEKIKELTSNEGNKFVISFKNKDSSSLFISAVFDDGIVKTFYESDFPLEKIKENKAFGFYDTIEEILGELFPLIEEDKIHLTEEKNKNNIKINFDLPFNKFKNIEFEIDEKKKTDIEKINELYEIIITQNKEINDLKKDVNDLKNLENYFNELKKKMNNLENEYRQILNKKKFEEDIMINTKIIYLNLWMKLIL